MVPFHHCWVILVLVGLFNATFPRGAIAQSTRFSILFGLGKPSWSGPYVQGELQPKP
jgi:hypothetical protein